MRVCVVGLLFLASATANAGAWTRAAGDHFVRMSAELYEAGNYQSASGAIFAGGSFRSQQYALYAEVGVLPWYPVQLSISLPLSYGAASFVEPGAINDERGLATTVRLGDLRMGAQTEIYSGVVQVSGGLELKVPMYSNDEIGAGPMERSHKVNFPYPGEGQIDVAPWIYSGTSVGPAFFELAVGYLLRTDTFVGWDKQLDDGTIGPSRDEDIHFGDGFSFRAKAGITFGPVTGILELDGTKSIQEDVFTREQVRISPAIFVDLWRGLAWDVRFTADLWATNGPQGYGVGTGVSWRFPYPNQD